MRGQQTELEPTSSTTVEENADNTDDIHRPIQNLANIPKLKQDDTITYRDCDTGTMITARIVVDDLKVSGTPSNIADVQEENVMVLEDISMDNAKVAELDNWKQNEVYKKVEDMAL